MRKPVRRLVCALLALAVLACGAYGLSAGDSLISLSYLTQTFLPQAVKAGEAAAGALQQTYDSAKEELDAVQRALLDQEEGEELALYSASLQPTGWGDGEQIILPTGSGFLMEEGIAVVTHQGAVVDVTEGAEVNSGAYLVKNHRYLVGEDTQAAVDILSCAARLGVQGSYIRREGREDPAPFYDVCRYDWYYAPVNHVFEKGLFSGVEEHVFGPDASMSRAMLMTVLFRLAGSPMEELEGAQAAFSDVADTDWFAPYVRWGASQEITAGTGPDTFSPNRQVPREQVVVLLHSFAVGYLGHTLEDRAELTGYQDLDQVSDWALDALSWAAADGVLASSAPDQSLRPKDPATRAEVAAMLWAFSGKYL